MDRGLLNNQKDTDNRAMTDDLNLSEKERFYQRVFANQFAVPGRSRLSRLHPEDNKGYRTCMKNGCLA
jgi:hypothetical protein